MSFDLKKILMATALQHMEVAYAVEETGWFCVCVCGGVLDFFWGGGQIYL